MSQNHSSNAAPAVGPALLDNLHWRLVGPFRGGRVVAVAGDPRDYLTFYFGSTGGGVWKTADAGLSWTNVSDGFFQRASVGALAVADSDSNVIYAGMGECCIRSNVSHGDGVYRSDNAGLSWTHCGLAATRHIARIRVDPRDPQRVYVAALGHAHGPNPERGVYRSSDGGRTWELVLHRGSDAGAVDLVMDPTNPRILYVSFWQARRLPWSIESGGPGSGLWRSTDGGDSWCELSRSPGLPSGALGRIGVTACTKPGRLWAIVQAEDGAVFRSDDYGAHWVRLSAQPELRFRPWYYGHIFADPGDAETVWVLNIGTWRSHDGGQTFTSVSVPHGDNHDLWIDPSNSHRLILGGDGGGNVSLDGGSSWSSCYNQPTAELYHVTTDNREPYRIYAAQQDNSTISLPSHSEAGAITMADAYAVAGGESGHIVVRPDDPDVVFAGSYRGSLTRYDHASRSARWIAVWPELTWATALEVRHRFNWTAPLAPSPHDPSVLYHGANEVFRSGDDGVTWAAISPDLTRNDPEKLMSSGGPITPDDSGAEYYCTIFALAESPAEAGVIWAGTDDGLVQVTRDGGASWANVTPPDLPDWSVVSCVEPSAQHPGTAYIAVERHKLDDFSPYLWRTDDFGATWQRIDRGLPDGEFCRVIREDPTSPSWLYCGTEADVHASLDRGETWMSIRGQLPRVPVHDLTIHQDDLIAATHGRSIWVLDDLTALRQFADAEAAPKESAFLFAPRQFVEFATRELFSTPPKPGRSYINLETVVLICDARSSPGTEAVTTTLADAGANRPHGVVVLFWLPTGDTDTCSITFSFADGRPIRTFDYRRRRREGDLDASADALALGNGLNRLVWDARHEPNSWANTKLFKRTDRRGPRVPPGRYLVTLNWSGGKTTRDFDIAPDPRSRQPTHSRVAQYELATRIWNRIGDLDRACDYIQEAQAAASRWISPNTSGANSDEIRTRAESVQQRLRAVEERLVTLGPEPPMDRPTRTLDGKLVALLEVCDSPTGVSESTFAAANDLSEQLEAQFVLLDSIAERDLAALNTLIARMRAPALPIVRLSSDRAQT